jgi:hypothetical protein
LCGALGFEICAIRFAQARPKTTISNKLLAPSLFGIPKHKLVNKTDQERERERERERKKERKKEKRKRKEREREREKEKEKEGEREKEKERKSRERKDSWMYLLAP